MTAPKWASALLRRVAPSHRADDVLGDLEEAHRKRVQRRGRAIGNLLTAIEALDVAASLVLNRVGRRDTAARPSTSKAEPRVRRSRWQMPSVVSGLDVKLGLRMLVKQPGLTCAAVFALAIGIPVGLMPTHMVNVIDAPLPVDEGDRIQMLRNFNVAISDAEAPSLQDFVEWREELTTFQALGAATLWASYNVISEDGRAAPVRGAEVTASMFDILRVPPLLGRTLISADEVIGAPTVVVIGHDVWQLRLGGDPDVVGRVIRIGRVSHTVVGVMPEDFRFPIRDNLWLPLRVNVPAHEGGQEREHVVFGRLSDGVSAEEAQAELTTVGRRMAIEFPETHGRLQLQAWSFMNGLVGGPRGGVRNDPEFYGMQGIALLVLVVACTNVGMLIFARTAARSSELAVRTALGASRTRVISQLFTEALLLAVLAAGVGLLIGDRIVSIVIPLIEGDLLPYWLDFGVTRTTVFWALSLAVFSAAVAGVVPALRVTGKAVQRNIQRATTGRSGIRFGGMSSALIVADVALAVVSVAAAVGLSGGVLGRMTEARDGVGIEAQQFLSAELRIPRSEPADPAAFDPNEFAARVRATQQELVRRLVAEPGVRGVAVGNALPGMDHPHRRIQLDGENRSDEPHGISSAHVDPDFFNALEQPILTGRGFALSDLGEDRSAVIVNAAFVDRVLGGRNPIGRRVRYTTRSDEEPGPWYEIVGVVEDLGMGSPVNLGLKQGLYHPLAPGETNPVRLAIHVGDDPESFTPRLRELSAQVDPAAIISDPVTLSEVFSYRWLEQVLGVGSAGILTGVLLVLAASGIYALMSFTVAERTREIGIRGALGAQRSSIVFTIARRALAQLGVGILLGMLVAGWLLSVYKSEMRSTYSPVVVALMLGVGVMVLIGMLACTAPTLRAMRIMPTEALREGG